MSAKGDAPDAPVPKVKGEVSKALDRLVDLVQEQIAKDPYERDGKLWCKDPYSLAPVMGMSERTMRRWFKDNPTVFRLQTVRVEGRRMAIVRIADKDEPPYSLTQEAKYLARMWETRVGRPHTPKEFGMIYHFVKECPAGIEAKEIFKLVLNEWGAFMAIVKTSLEFKQSMAIVKVSAEADHGAKLRYYRYPRLSIIRRFVHLAVDFWLQTQQWQGKSVDITFYSDYSKS
jgi:hypothetical protein